MNDLPKLYFTMETYLFPLLEEELCELTAKMKEFLRIVEMIKPSRFITSTLRWSGLGRPMKDREKMLRAFFLKVVLDVSRWAWHMRKRVIYKKKTIFLKLAHYETAITYFRRHLCGTDWKNAGDRVPECGFS